MPRSVNHVASRARRKKVLKLAKGYFGRRKNVWTVAKNAVEKGLNYAYRDRRVKKREFRSLWIVRINAACRIEGMSYSQFMGKLNAAGLTINRKVLADLAMNHPDAFKAILTELNNGLKAEATTSTKPAKKAAAPKAEASSKAKAAPKAEVKEKAAPKAKAIDDATEATAKVIVEDAPVADANETAI